MLCLGLLIETMTKSLTFFQFCIARNAINFEWKPQMRKLISILSREWKNNDFHGHVLNCNTTKVPRVEPKMFLKTVLFQIMISSIIWDILFMRFTIRNQHGKKMTIADKKSTKSLSNFENKQPNCTVLFIFVFELSFIDCTLSKIVGFDQFCTAVEQKLVTANRKLVYFKMSNTFCWFTVQNCCYFLLWRSKKDLSDLIWCSSILSWTW